MNVTFYRVIRAIIAGFSRLFWRLSVEGREKLPSTGAFVLAPIHRSNVDFAVAAALTPRPMRFLAKHTIWKYGLGRIWEALGAIPVVRGTPDRSSMRAIDDALVAGVPVVMFPEGTRQVGPLVQPLFDGVAYAALRAGVPVIPVGIGGSDRAMPKGSKLLRPVKIHVIIGDPIVPEPRSEGGRVPRRAIKELTVDLAARIQATFDEARANAA